MDPITVTMPASMTDGDYMAAVADMSQQLAKAGVSAGKQLINLSQAVDGSWVITGSQNDNWWAA